MLGLVVVPICIIAALEIKAVKWFPRLGTIIQRYRSWTLALFVALLGWSGNLFTTAALILISAAMAEMLLIQAWYVVHGYGSSRGIGFISKISARAEPHRKETERHVKQVVATATVTWAVARVPLKAVLTSMDLGETWIKKFNYVFPKGGKHMAAATATVDDLSLGGSSAGLDISDETVGGLGRRFARWVARNAAKLSGSFTIIMAAVVVAWYYKLFLEMMMATAAATTVVWWGTIGFVSLGILALISLMLHAFFGGKKAAKGA